MLVSRLESEMFKGIVFYLFSFLKLNKIYELCVRLPIMTIKFSFSFTLDNFDNVKLIKIS